MQNKSQQKLFRKRSDAKKFYDRTAGSELQPLNIGSYAYVKPPPCKRGKEWAYGQITETNGNRSYTIRTPISIVRRNRPSNPIQPVIMRTVVSNIASGPKRTETIEHPSYAEVARATLNTSPTSASLKSVVSSPPPPSINQAVPCSPAPNAAAPKTPCVHESGRPRRVAGLPKRYEGYVMK